MSEDDLLMNVFNGSSSFFLFWIPNEELGKVMMTIIRNLRKEMCVETDMEMVTNQQGRDYTKC